MTMPNRAAQAYQVAISHRSPRHQEADLFRQATGALRVASRADGPGQARAIADNTRLWHAVMDVLRDPGNRLPDSIRAGLLSIGHAVMREMRAPNPDVAFLIEMNEHIVAGLTS